MSMGHDLLGHDPREPVPAPSDFDIVPLPLWHRLTAGGGAGNARLTAAAGLVLLVLLFLEGLTLPAIRLLLVPHVFVGVLLIPPLALKLASTGYRFIRYYTGNPHYRAAGPPHLVLRVLAPLLVVSVILLVGSGVLLLIVGPADDAWRRIHTLAFLAWFWIMTVHVLAYAPRAIRLAWRDRATRGRNAVAGVLSRHVLIAGSLLLGTALAVAALPMASAWVHAMSVDLGFH